MAKSVGHDLFICYVYILLGGVALQVFCPFSNWVVGFVCFYCSLDVWFGGIFSQSVSSACFHGIMMNSSIDELMT